MPYIDEVITGCQTLGKAITVAQMLGKHIDLLNHPEQYYKPRDIQIMEAARDAYRALFIGKELPLPLQYYHETISDEGERKKLAENRTDMPLLPPRQLQKKYMFTCDTVGTNIIATTCGNAVIEIQNYLNALNENAPKFIYRAKDHYGHHSDSIRFLFCLIAQSFIKLSSIDTNRIEGLEEATRYVSLSKAPHD